MAWLAVNTSKTAVAELMRIAWRTVGQICERVAAEAQQEVDLLDGLSARCGIPDTQRANAHLVREYRNSLIHERDDRPELVPIELVRKYLCHYFSFLPPRW